jgi:hypothetical protein
MLAIGAAIPTVTRAQQLGIPFGNNALFEPEISVVNSGVLLDAQATVSADRKYVTLTMRPQASQLLALRTFNFQSGGAQVQLPGGVVGGVNPFIGGPGIVNNVNFQRVNPPMRAAAGNGGAIITRRGITPLVLND